MKSAEYHYPQEMYTRIDDLMRAIVADMPSSMGEEPAHGALILATGRGISVQLLEHGERAVITPAWA